MVACASPKSGLGTVPHSGEMDGKEHTTKRQVFLVTGDEHRLLGKLRVTTSRALYHQLESVVN